MSEAAWITVGVVVYLAIVVFMSAMGSAGQGN